MEWSTKLSEFCRLIFLFHLLIQVRCGSDIGSLCNNKGDVEPIKDDCTTYKQCLSTPDGSFKWIKIVCPEGSNFDLKSADCTPGKCENADIQLKEEEEEECTTPQCWEEWS